jgi:hypothetical protein
MLFNPDSLEIIDRIANRIGLGSITTAVGASAVQAQEQTQQVVEIANSGLVTYALVISAIGGILFIIEKAIVIYLRIKHRNDRMD